MLAIKQWGLTMWFVLPVSCHQLQNCVSCCYWNYTDCERDMENVLSFSLNFPTDCANSGTIAPFLIPLCFAFPFIILSLNLFVQSNLSNNRCHKQNLLTCSSRSPWQHSGVPKSLLHLRTSITLPTTTQSINVQKLTTLLFMDDSLFQILQNFSLRHWHFTEMTASNTNWILFPGIQSTKELFSPG